MSTDLALFEIPDPPTGALRESFSIEPISTALATEMVIDNHYLHRAAPCSAAFGLIAGGYVYGVIIYGTPSSAPLRAGIAGPEHALNVTELTRLWVDDRVPKNGESYLIGNTVRRAGKEIVVSFADAGVGHVGTVYQATNWLYTGLSAKRTDWAVEGVEKHGQTWADSHTAEEMREKYGAAFSLRERSRKHRYIFLNARGGRRKALLRALRYPVVPYPKSELQDGAA